MDCDQCGKSYAYLQALETHLRFRHRRLYVGPGLPSRAIVEEPPISSQPKAKRPRIDDDAQPSVTPSPRTPTLDEPAEIFDISDAEDAANGDLEFTRNINDSFRELVNGRGTTTVASTADGCNSTDDASFVFDPRTYGLDGQTDKESPQPVVPVASAIPSRGTSHSQSQLPALLVSTPPLVSSSAASALIAAPAAVVAVPAAAADAPVGPVVTAPQRARGPQPQPPTAPTSAAVVATLPPTVAHVGVGPTVEVCEASTSTIGLLRGSHGLSAMSVSSTASMLAHSLLEAEDPSNDALKAVLAFSDEAFVADGDQHTLHELLGLQRSGPWPSQSLVICCVGGRRGRQQPWSAVWLSCCASLAAPSQLLLSVANDRTDPVIFTMIDYIVIFRRCLLMFCIAL